MKAERGTIMTLGEKLQRLRKSRGWSQEQLASEIHVSRQALSKWELGAAVPDTENVLQLARLFDVSTDFLLKDEWEEDKSRAVQQPAVSARSHRRIHPLTGLGCSLSALSAAGLLILGILSSIHPAYVDYASVVTATGEVIETVNEAGLKAYLTVHHLHWLFDLCLTTVFAGMIVSLLPWWMPVIRSWGQKIARWVSG